MKAFLLPFARRLVVGLLVGLAGCAWLKPPVDGQRGRVGARDSDYWGYSPASWGHESREREPSRDFKSWADQQMRQFNQSPSPGSFPRGR